MQRSISEKIFLLFFLPTVVVFYLIYKYPTWFVSESEVVSSFYWFGKSTSFWYSTVYSLIVAFIALKVLFNGKNPYVKSRKNISKYQRNKFTSIFVSQTIFFYFIPYYLPFILRGGEFFNDQYVPLNKNAYVYVYNGFTSMGGFIYIFILVPLTVWFFGKRYCSWFCACGNLAEVIGITKWGNQWVTHYTPRGETSKKMEYIQYAFFAFAILFGLVLFLDFWKIFTSQNLLTVMRSFQDLVVDLIFGALIGIGAYPFLGTRIWCRYGCPLAAGMRIFGKFSKSRFAVVANENCKGLDLCTKACPMGIDVASFAHKDKKPIMQSFGLDKTPCIGCGGCIDACPMDALSFKKLKG